MSIIIFLLTHPWLAFSGLLISSAFTYLWYAYYEYRWPFHNLPRF